MVVDSGWVIAAAAVLGLLGGIGVQWTLYERRLSAVEAEATNALQTGAEAEQRLEELAESNGDTRLDVGETVRAMQQKISDVEKWARDTFVRKESFDAVLARLERAQEVRDDRLERQFNAIVSRLDHLAK
jgi:hypothetical protein